MLGPPRGRAILLDGRSVLSPTARPHPFPTMHTPDAFLDDIRADPADDTSRLVYADWLDEHGHPERAEFVRVQVGLARPWPEGSGECRQCHARRTGGQHTNGPCRCTPAWRVLCRRERELLTPARFWEWFGGLVASAWPGTPLVHVLPGPACEVSYSSRPGVNEGRDVWTLTTRRGFVESVTLSCADWLAHAPALVRAAPLTRVTLSDRKPEGYVRRWHWQYGADDGRDHDPSGIPAEIMRHGLGDDVGMHAKRYRTRRLAHAALSRAALAWALAAHP